MILFSKINKAWYLVILLLIILMVREGCNKSYSGDILSKLDSYKDTSIHYKGLHDADIAYNKAIEIRTQKDFDLVGKTMNDTVQYLMKKFKKLQSINQIKSTIYIEGDTIKLHDTIPCVFDPIKIIRDSTDYHFVGTISNKTFSIDTMLIPNVQTIVFGEMKHGLFKRPISEAHVVNSNKLIKTGKIKYFIYSPYKKWYERPVIHFAVGILTGAIVYKTTIH